MGRVEMDFLVGITDDNSLITTTVTLSPYFAVSFQESYPSVITQEYLEMMAESLIDALDAQTTLDLLERLDCKPSELVDEFSRTADLEEIIDISLYPENYQVGDKDIYFEASGCGQMDVRNKIAKYAMPTDLFDLLINMWDKYHLKEANSEIQELRERLDDDAIKLGHEQEWVQEWLNKLFTEEVKV